MVWYGARRALQCLGFRGATQSHQTEAAAEHTIPALRAFSLLSSPPSVDPPGLSLT